MTAEASIDEVVAALNQPQHPAAVATAARVVQDLCVSNHADAAANRVAYTTAGAIFALVAAGTTHLHHTGVVEAVCHAFGNLACNNDANKVCCQIIGVLFLFVCLFVCLFLSRFSFEFVMN